MAETLLEVRNVKKYFPVRGGLLSGLLSRQSRYLHAVDDVSFDVYYGETLAIVGESGCGKTTLGRVILGLDAPTSGQVLFRGQDIFALKGSQLTEIRKAMQIIFQDPSASLNPRKRVSQILSRPLLIHGLVPKSQIESRCLELLDLVGMSPAETFIHRYPHEFSGGQRQRLVIARAISLEPKIIIADEPVSSLDVSVRAQILKLMKGLQDRFHLTFFFITHDLAVVRSISSRVAVMYLGEIVEFADCEELFSKPMHPYTHALLAATPIPNPKIARSRKVITLSGELPSPIDPPKGCRFHTRCPMVFDRCRVEKPRLLDVAANHKVACHLFE